MRNRGAIVTNTIAIAIMKAVVQCEMPTLLYGPGGSLVTSDISLSRSLFRRMNWVIRKGTKSTKCDRSDVEEQVIICFRLI